MKSKVVHCCSQQVFEIQKWDEEMYRIGRKNSYGREYLQHDGTIKYRNAWWTTKKEAEIFLAGWLLLNRNFQGLYKLEQEIAIPEKPKLETNVDQIDYEPQYELGTRLVTNSGTRYQYGALDFGINYTDDMGRIYKCIQYKWFCTKL